MTKVQLRFRLQKALDQRMMTQIADAHSIYGIYRITMDPKLEQLTVEYDASRLQASEVGSALAAAGIPIQQIP